MELQKLKEEIKANILGVMQSVIDQDVDGSESKLYYCKPNDVITYFQSLGAEYDNDFETNGWQWDFWFSIDYDGYTYKFSGDGYYDDYMSIEKVEIGEDDN